MNGKEKQEYIERLRRNIETAIQESEKVDISGLLARYQLPKPKPTRWQRFKAWLRRVMAWLLEPMA
jgi:hypothetical protein